MPTPNEPHGGSLWNNRFFSIFLALVLGLATWIVVTVYIDPQGNVTRADVPIN